MKKLLTLTAVGALLTAPATAVQKCVALNSSNTFCEPWFVGENKVDWTAPCTTNGISVTIKGIGVCALNGAGSGDTADALTLNNSDTSTHVNCWCKMISPAVSSWVFVGEFGYANDCAASCANYCSYDLMDSRTFTEPLFSTMSD